MSSASARRLLTIAIHPTARGFGWVAFEGPFTPFDWGTVEARRDKNRKCLERVERLFERLQPSTLVLEAFDKRNSVRTDRIARLCRAMVALAADHSMEVVIFTRRDIQVCFRPVGAATRQEIAEAIARHVPALQHHLPSKRRAWDSEHKRMPIFSAAALVLTHFRLPLG